MPNGGHKLFRWFFELSNRRGSNGYGPNPISPSDMAAWFALTGRDPEPWEIFALSRMDIAAVRAMIPKTDVEPPTPTMTPALFKSMFSKAKQ